MKKVMRITREGGGKENETWQRRRFPTFLKALTCEPTGNKVSNVDSRRPSRANDALVKEAANVSLRPQSVNEK